MIQISDFSPDYRGPLGWFVYLYTPKQGLDRFFYIFTCKRCLQTKMFKITIVLNKKIFSTKLNITFIESNLRTLAVINAKRRI